MAGIFYNPNVFAWGDAIGKGVESYQGAKDNKLKDLQREKLYRDLERQKAVDTGMMGIQKNQQAGLYAPTRSPAAGAVIEGTPPGMEGYAGNNLLPGETLGQRTVETPPQRSMLDDLKNNALSAGDVDSALKYDQMAKLEQQLSMDKYKRVGDLIKTVADAEESLGLESGSLLKTVVAPMLKNSGDRLLMSVDLSSATVQKINPLETLLSGLKNNKGEEQPFDLSVTVDKKGNVSTTVKPKNPEKFTPKGFSADNRLVVGGEQGGLSYKDTGEAYTGGQLKALTESPMMQLPEGTQTFSQMPEAVKNTWYEMYEKDRTAVPPFYYRDPASKNAFISGFAEWSNKKGGTGADIIAERGSTKALVASLSQQQKQRGMMGSFVKNLNKQLARVDEIAGEVKRIDVRFLDLPMREVRTRIVGSGLEKTYEAYLLEISNEIGKLSTGSAASIRELSVDAQERWAKIHDPNLSINEIRKVLQETGTMANMRLDSTDEELSGTILKLQGGSPTGKSTATHRYVPGQGIVEIK